MDPKSVEWVDHTQLVSPRTEGGAGSAPQPSTLVCARTLRCRTDLVAAVVISAETYRRSVPVAEVANSPSGSFFADGMPRRAVAHARRRVRAAWS